MIEPDEYRNSELCAECGGKCCRGIYAPPYDLNWDQLHNDPRHIFGGGYYAEYGVAPLTVKLGPHACEYLSRNGCIIPWKKRPAVCRTYRCGLWRELVYRRF